MADQYADAEIIVAGLKRKLNSHGESLRIARATVTAVTNGLVSIQRGDADTAEDAGSPRIENRGVAVGDDVAIVNLGGAPLVLGPIGPNTYYDATIGPWFRENVGSGGAADYGMRLPVPDSSTAFVATGVGIEVKQGTAGRIRGGILWTSTDRTAGTTTLGVKVNNQASAVPLTGIVINGTNLRSISMLLPWEDSIPFAAGDVIEANLIVDAAWTPTTADATALLFVTYEIAG
jgi:hypothetical protein